MNLTVDIPSELYPEALRLIADLIEGNGQQDLRTQQEPEVRAWSPEGHLPNAWEGDFQILATLYASVTVTARRLIDELLRAGSEPVHQDDLVDRLGLNGTSALAGTVGHITKTAESLGRRTPIHRDASRKTYSVDPGLREHFLQARLWSCSEILDLEGWSIDEPPREYVHEFGLGGTTYRHVSEHPKRYLLLVREHLKDEYSSGFYKTTDALMEAFGEAFDPGEALVLEFVPDHDAGILRGIPSRGSGYPFPPDYEAAFPEVGLEDGLGYLPTDDLGVEVVR